MKDVPQHILAVFIDFENLALGFKDRRGRFEIERAPVRVRGSRRQRGGRESRRARGYVGAAVFPSRQW